MAAIKNLQDKIEVARTGNHNHSFNLDDGAVEYFEFTLFGKKYKFRYPTTEEFEKINEFKEAGDDKGLQEFLYPFIMKVDEDAPDFKKVEKKMLPPHLRNFNEMITEEFRATKG